MNIIIIDKNNIESNENMECINNLIIKHKSFIIQNIKETALFVNQLKQLIVSNKMTSKDYIATKLIPIKARLFPINITKVSNTLSKITNMITNIPDYEIVSYADNSVSVFYMKEIQDLNIKVNELEKINELIANKKSFIIYGINSVDAQSMTKELLAHSVQQTARTIEKQIELQSMTCRIRIANRAFIVPVVASTMLIPGVNVAAMATVTAATAGTLLAHKFITHHPDYEITKYVVDNKITVIYQKYQELFEETVKLNS